MILGVEEAFLLISLEFMHAAATDGAGRGLVARVLYFLLCMASPCGKLGLPYSMECQSSSF